MATIKCIKNVDNDIVIVEEKNNTPVGLVLAFSPDFLEIAANTSKEAISLAMSKGFTEAAVFFADLNRLYNRHLSYFEMKKTNDNNDKKTFSREQRERLCGTM